MVSSSFSAVSVRCIRHKTLVQETAYSSRFWILFCMWWYGGHTMAQHLPRDCMPPKGAKNSMTLFSNKQRYRLDGLGGLWSPTPVSAEPLALSSSGAMPEASVQRGSLEDEFSPGVLSFTREPGRRAP